jgi:hypothetical protein
MDVLFYGDYTFKPITRHPTEEFYMDSIHTYTDWCVDKLTQQTDADLEFIRNNCKTFDQFRVQYARIQSTFALLFECFPFMYSLSDPNKILFKYVNLLELLWDTEVENRPIEKSIPLADPRIVSNPIKVADPQEVSVEAIPVPPPPQSPYTLPKSPPLVIPDEITCSEKRTLLETFFESLGYKNARVSHDTTLQQWSESYRKDGIDYSLLKLTALQALKLPVNTRSKSRGSILTIIKTLKK